MATSLEQTTDSTVAAPKGKRGGARKNTNRRLITAARENGYASNARARAYVSQKFIEEAESALEFLKSIMKDPLQETPDRMKAATEILDRGLGKAVSTAEIIAHTTNTTVTTTAVADFTKMDAKQLKQLETLLASALLQGNEDQDTPLIDITPEEKG